MMRPHRESFRIRSYECDALGHVNNAVYQLYLEQTTLDAWANAGCTPRWFSAHQVSWFLKQASIDYRHPAVANDVLEVTTWVSSWETHRVQHEYEFHRQSDGELIAAATASWSYVDPGTLQRREVPTNLRLFFGEIGPTVLKPYQLPVKGLKARSFHWQHQIRRYEVDATQHVNPAVYLNWIEEAKFRAAESVGWPLSQMQAANFVTFQIRHDTQYFQPAHYLYDLRKVRGTWLHEVYRRGSNDLIARNYSTGAFLNLDRRPAPAPQAMLEALLYEQNARGGAD